MKIIFSSSLLNQLNSLTHQECNYFVGKIKEIITTNITSEIFKKSSENNQKTIISISYGSSHYVLGAILSQQLTIKIFAFFSQNINLINDELNHDNIINLNFNNESDLFTNILNKCIKNNDLNKNKEVYFQQKSNDLYSYSLKYFNSKETEVILSPEQFNIISNNSNLPILLTGNKGTGKTITGLYSALKHTYDYQENNNAKILYLTANPHTKTVAEQSIHDVTKGDISNLKIQDYKSFIKSFGDQYQFNGHNQFLAQRQITEYKFIEKFCKQKKILSVNHGLLWKEIRQIIKGSNKSLGKDNNLISFNEYLTFKGQSLLPIGIDFKHIYDLATEYQSWLEEYNFWDQLDLIHHTYQKLAEDYQGNFNVIYVDDVHSLTELEIQLVFKLLKVDNQENYTPQLFLMGEDDSIVTNKGFNWGRVKKIAVEEYLKSPQWTTIRRAIEPKQLNYNFVFSDKVVKLTNSLVNLAVINNQGDAVIAPQFSYITSQKKPLIIAGLEEEILDKDYSLGSGNAIIVPTEKEREKVIKSFRRDCERVLTIDEIEGLEFDEVLVWQFFKHLPDLINPRGNLLAQQYDLLYSCIKTAKYRVYFYDHDVNDFWNLSGISDLVEIGYPTELDNFFAENDEDKIANITNNYLNQGNSKAYKIASQLYFQSNDILGAAKVEALLEEVQGNWGKAGDIWNKLLIFDEAIRCWNEVDKKLWEAKWASSKKEDWSQRGLYFEKIKSYTLAHFCYEKGDDFAGKLRCLEANDKWELAGDKCREKNLSQQAIKYYDLAHQYYQETGQFKTLIQMWTKLGKLDRVALIWEELKQWEKAGNCWQKQGNVEKAAVCWEKAQKWSEAQKCWLELERWEDLGISYENQQQWDLAGEVWQKQGNMERAAFCFQNGNKWSVAETLWRDLECWGYVAIALQQQNKWEEAALIWQKTTTVELEALCYEQLKDWERAENSWLKANNWRRSVLCAQKQEKWLESAESWENLGEWKKAGEAWEKIKETEKAALCYEQGDYWQQAQRCWTIIGNQSAIANTLEKQEKWLESAQIWETLKQWKLAGNSWEKAGEIEQAALCYEKGENWREAEECWRILGNESKIQENCVKQGRWQTAANDWLKANQIEQAALCYEKCQDWQRAEKYWREINNWEKLAPVCEEMKKWESAAQAYLKSDNSEKAALCYEKLEDWQKAEECWRKAWKWEKLAIACEHQQKWQEAANAWVKADNLEKAVAYYEQIGDWANAEECWRKLSNWRRLAMVCEHQAKWEESAQLWNFLGEWEKAALACVKMDDVETAIKYYEKGGYTEEIKKLSKIKN